MGQVTCKVRGFSLNYRVSQMLNLNSMRGALQCWMKGDEVPELVTMKTLILRNKLKGYVYTHIFPKHQRVVYNKRRVLENFGPILLDIYMYKKLHFPVLLFHCYYCNEMVNMSSSAHPVIPFQSGSPIIVAGLMKSSKLYG